MYIWQIIHSGSDLSSTVGQCLLKSALLSINVIRKPTPFNSNPLLLVLCSKQICLSENWSQNHQGHAKRFYYCSELHWEFQRLGWTPEICCEMITEWAVRSSLFSTPKAELMAMLCICFPSIKRRHGIGKEVKTIWRFPPIV